MHSSWTDILSKAYNALDNEYKEFLEKDTGYFPTQDSYLNAFKTLEKEKVKYILFGQDPYPRKESAGGYAFIDTNVTNIFAETGLSKEVNKATSLRNFIKMLLLQRGDLSPEDLSQKAISKIDKTQLITSIEELKENFEKNGVLLLNTALIFTAKQNSNKNIRAWRPFIEKLLEQLEEDSPKLILFGTHAKALKKNFHLSKFQSIELEHPYNHTFITNSKAHELFGSMHLLEK